MQKINLNGTWHAAQVNAGGKQTNRVKATVPGCIHTDLQAAGKIPDPYYRDNEQKLQWIGEADWQYSRTFRVPASLLQHEHVFLRCDGLDTLATLLLNGTEVGRTDNMFRIWEFDVKQLLHPGQNSIDITFESTVPYIRRKQAEFAMPGWQAPHEIAGRAYVRKEPCNYGWDWGPVLITCGIWRSIELVAFDTARLTGVGVEQDHSTPGQVILTIRPELETTRALSMQVHVSVSHLGAVVGEIHMPASEVAKISIPDPQLWWPNNLGDQPLYDVSIELLSSDNKVLDSTMRRIGLRTLVLDRHPDEWGESFQFVVNGVPFFAKGGDWIPPDTFVNAVSDAQYRDLLVSVRDANMNMLRVWGGGIYEQDVFYNLCDELGICVWQDFMFACSAYPTFDADFLQNVRAEAQDTVYRLRHHASIALWCGNNELEQGLVGPKWTDHTMSWDDYSKLFDRLLPEVTHELDPQRSYWPSSPHTPHGDRSDFNNPTMGDAHLWDVWHGRKPFEWYRTCKHRFNSEFGFQSFPEPRTVFGYTSAQDRNITSYIMEQHQRSGIGNAVIIQYMLDWFRLPTSFEMTLQLSQVLQGMAIKYAVEHWRREMPRGMGTLYWQIDDCWPVASWSSIDSLHHWKALHYMARSFYAPILISAVEDAQTGKVTIYLSNDMRQLTGGDMAWWLTNVQGDVLARGRKNTGVDPLKSTQVECVELGKYLRQYGPRQLLFWVEYSVKGKRVSSNFATFARPKHLDLVDPGINVVVTRQKDGAFGVVLTAQSPALWTWLDIAGLDATYSDNYVHLFPGRPTTISVQPAQTVTESKLVRALRVHSLIDTYQS